jgi:hypothetical protein
MNIQKLRLQPLPPRKLLPLPRPLARCCDGTVKGEKELQKTHKYSYYGFF